MLIRTLGRSALLVVTVADRASDHAPDDPADQSVIGQCGKRGSHEADGQCGIQRYPTEHCEAFQNMFIAEEIAEKLRSVWIECTASQENNGKTNG
ncbi:MAG: hypothetical protein ACEPO2_09750 [Pelagibaca sp.]